MARTESLWQERDGGYMESTNPNGLNVLIKGADRYINFNSVSGSLGYGIRDNDGVIEFKNSSGAWTAIGTGGGAVDSVNGQTGVVSIDLQSVTDVASTTTNNIDALSFNGVALTTAGSTNNFLAEDGVYRAIPTSGTLTFMFSGVNSEISGYESMPSLPSYTAGALATKTTAGVSTTPTLLEEFATNVGFPNITVIPVGFFKVHYQTQKNAGANNYHSFAEIYKRTAGGTETLLATTDNTSDTAVNTIVDCAVEAFLNASVTLLSTDRIVVKVYAKMISSTATIDLLYDDNTDARLEMPSNLVDATNFVPYTGATLDVDLGVHSLTATSLIKAGGTSSEFLKADGSVDSSTYLTDLSGFTTDDLSEGSTNIYSQWANVTGGINYAGGKVNVGLTGGLGKFNVEGYSDIIITGTSTPTYAGTYERAGTYNGYSYWEIVGGGKFIYYDRGYWFTTTILGTETAGFYQTFVNLGSASTPTTSAWSGHNGATGAIGSTVNPIVNFTGAGSVGFNSGPVQFTYGVGFGKFPNNYPLEVLSYMSVAGTANAGTVEQLVLYTNTSPRSFITAGAGNFGLTLSADYSLGNIIFNTAGVERFRLEGTVATVTGSLTTTGNGSFGTNSPSARIHAVSTTVQQRLGYDAFNYFDTTVGSTGITTFNAVGSGASFVFSDTVQASGFISSDGSTGATATTGGATFKNGLYISGTISGGGGATQVWNEVPTGSINSSNTVFTTAGTYATGKLRVFLNGLRQTLTTDYTETTGTTFTFVTAPTTGDVLVVDYQQA